MAGGPDDDHGRIDQTLNKVPGGFDPEVCDGCPEQGDGPLKRCGLCNCPTLRYFLLDMSGRTPEGCLREDEHKREG